jgi:hypothetical protein
MRFPMWDTLRKGPEENISQEALDKLKAALIRIAKSKYPTRDPLVCGVCHNLVALQARDICADENGQIVHADCYVQRIVGSKKPTSQQDQA